jgi:hypothetical protein
MKGREKGEGRSPNDGWRRRKERGIDAVLTARGKIQHEK